MSEVGPDEPSDPMLEALWTRALEAWDDDKPHVALLDYALREQKLPDVAARYRAVKDSEPDKAARAQKKLDGIVVAATHMLLAMKTPPPERKVPLWLTLSAFLLMIFALGWLAFSVLRRGHR